MVAGNTTSIRFSLIKDLEAVASGGPIPKKQASAIRKEMTALRREHAGERVDACGKLCGRATFS